MAKTVVLVGGGSYGLMSPSDYAKQIADVERVLKKVGATVEIVECDNLRARLQARGVDAAVFFTRGLINLAIGTKEEFQIDVFLLTALDTGLPRGKVTIIRKPVLFDSDSFRTLILGP